MKSIPLADVFEIYRGGSPRPIDHYITDDPDGVNWVLISDASASSKYIVGTKKKIKPAGVIRSRLVKPGDFLLTNSMSFGRPYIMKTSGCIHDGWLVLSPKMQDIDPNYFYHLLGSPKIYAEFKRLAPGATVKNLNIDLVKSVKVAVPPLDEQRRIAAILDQADALRRKRAQTMALLEFLGQSIFSEMFDTRSVPRKSLSCLLEVTAGLVDPRRKEYESLPHIGPEHIVRDTGELLPYRTAREDGVTSGKFLFEPHAILFSKIRPYLNKVVLAPERGLCSADMYALIVRDGAARRHYVWYLLRQSDFLNYAAGLSNRANIPKLNREQLLAYQAPAPSIELQIEFERRIAVVEKLKGLAKEHARHIETMFNGLQAAAFVSRRASFLEQAAE